MADGSGQTQLLLIGPEVEMLELLDEILTDSGFGVQTATDLATIEDRITDPDFDVIVCDELDGELDGLMVFDAMTETARDERPSFILLGDDPNGERIATCLSRDMEEYVVKPFDVAELVARIKKVVRTAGRIAQNSTPSPEEEAVGFEGDLDYINLPDLLMNLHQNGQTGKLQVYVEDGEYGFGFSTGELVEVTGPRGLQNRKAFYRSMREEGGQFRFLGLDSVEGSKNSSFANLANIILQAVQEADEYPLTRRNLPPDPVPVSLTAKVEETPLPENSAIQPLLEGLIKSTTIDILIHACPKTDLEAARELEELMMAEVLVQSEGGAAERAS